jgi:hypothetical protein
VPETIRIEADEFVFTMAAALGEVQILDEALFFYRLHTGNFYSQHGFHEASVRKKHESIAELARCLRERLEIIGISAEVLETVVCSIKTEADQLRLSLDGGAPWETVKTELAMYRMLHSEASWTHQVFKYATLLPAYFVSPRVYYKARRHLAESDLYVRARKVFFPAPQPRHVERVWKGGR